MRAKVVIPAPAKLLTTNAERQIHHMERAKIVKLWRGSAKVWANVSKMPRFQTAEVWFLVEQAKWKLADTGSHLPVGKAILDGLVDAKILPDDTGEFVTKVSYLPVIRGEKDQVTVGLVGEPRPTSVLVDDVPAVVLADYRARKIAAVARQQARCHHPKHPTGVCLDCGAKC